ncbi:MAG: hypothetical protein GF388_03290 [Candidatus Aegiribacteria sp.]|nr:hypothetical protein [Candidatus Aegiribacteria sp.]MBD3294293.1 hypothetical protein [Candidatus Fermentibacteria bacterium]
MKIRAYSLKVALAVLLCMATILMSDETEQYSLGFLDTDFDSIAAEAHQAYLENDFETAVELYLSYLRYNARDVSALYNLACCYGLLQDEDMAADFMLRAVRAGFDDIGWIMGDPDFDGVRNGEIFTPALDSLAAAVQEREEKFDTFYAPCETMLPVLVRLPENYEPSKEYQLLIGLHGYGANPESFARLWNEFHDRDFIYIVPRAPYPRFSGATPGYSWMIWSDNEDLSRSTAAGSIEYIGEVTRAALNTYNVSETYLMGFSQGCSFTYTAGLIDPNLYDGLICFAGWLDQDEISADYLEDTVDVRVFIAHGHEDQMVEYSASSNAFEYLSSHGFDVEFVDFQGGHTVDTETLRMAEEWMMR